MKPNIDNITEVALKLMEISDEAELFSFIADRLYFFSDGAIIVFNQFDPETRKVMVREIRSTDNERSIMKSFFGVEPEGLSFDVPETLRSRIQPGNLDLLENGLYELVFGQIPEVLSKQLESNLNLGNIYAIACSVHDDILGTVAIMTHDREQIRNKNLIESIVSQAALALKRLRAERSLKISEEKFSTAFHLNPEPLAITLENGTVIEVNDSVLDMFEVTRNDIIGKSIITFYTEPEKRKDLISALKTNGRVHNFELKLRTKTGKIRTALVSSEFLKFHRNNALLTVIHDITDMKNSEIELRKAKEKAEESDRLKSVFLSNMSHEIRTPMNGILGFANLLKNADLSPETQKAYIDAINTSGKRMLGIINDLIDISKIDSGQIEVKKVKTDLAKLLNEIFLKFDPDAEKSGLGLEFIVDLPDDFSVMTDDAKLEQILSNLIKNALRFTKSGRIEAGCKILDKQHIYFYVRDTGSGIRKEYQEKIFERFMQGETAAAHEGVGLGLAISKAYVEILGGRIGMESEPGIGSVFYFTIPVQAQYVILPSPQKAESPQRSFGIKHVLIVEDDEMSFLLLKEILKEIDLKIYRATNGFDALEIIKRHPEICLVLMDLKLPVMDGIEATTEIKKINPGMAVIIQSAYTDQEEIDKSFKAGSDDYITKPIDSRKLVRRVLELLK